MTPDQIAAARCAMENMREHNAAMARNEPHESPYWTHGKLSDDGKPTLSVALYSNDESVIVALAMWEHDPTTLTWDAVRQEPGWNVDGFNCVRCGTLRCAYLAYCNAMYFTATDFGAAMRPAPRTLGDLRKIMLLVGGETR